MFLKPPNHPNWLAMSKDDQEWLERLNDAASLLHINGLIPDSVRFKIMEKLVKLRDKKAAMNTKKKGKKRC